MITSMRGCVAYNDLWPWPISSRSFGLGLENRVRSVVSTVLDGFFPYLVQMITSMRRCRRPWKKKSTVLDGFFPYLAQMITSMRGCVAYNDLWPWPISSRSFGLGLENRVRSVASTVLDGFFPYLVQMITSMRRCVACDNLWPWNISSSSFDLDFENSVRSVMFSVLDRLFPYLPQIITTIRGCVEGAGGYPRRWHRLIYLVWNGKSIHGCIHGSDTGLILGLCPANERRRYKVTPSLIGWAQT